MSSAPTRHTHFKLVSMKEEGLERRLALAFGFMSFIPILIITWGILLDKPASQVLIFVSLSALFGYFFVARKMIHAVLLITRHASAVAAGGASGTIDVQEHGELGELAKAFNRITGELEQKIEELESSRQLVKKLLSRIGTAIVSYEGIDNILNLIMENTAGALEAQMGSLMLVDGEKQELYVKTTWSRNGSVADPARRIKLGDGIPGWVAKEGRPMRSAGRPSQLGFAANGHDDECAVLCVPLKLRDHPIGVIAVLRENTGKAFSDDDEQLVLSIGSQIAVAIENYRLNLDVERTYVETIMALALAVEAKDPYSAGHSKRVGFYAQQVGRQMRLDEDTCRMLNAGGVLHDIGKIGVKDEILLKPTPLTAEEEEIMHQHPLIGEAIVKPVRSLSKAVDLVRHHHEKYDGTGYPGHLKGEQIPLGARILAIVDTYDSMITDRPYRKRLPVETAKAELKRFAGTQYDPAIVEAFLKVLDEKDARALAQPPDPQAS